DEFVDGDGLELALHLDKVEFAKKKTGVLCSFVGGGTDENVCAKFLVKALEPRRKVHDVAHCSVGEAQLRTHGADGSNATVEAYPDVQMGMARGFPFGAQFGNAVHHEKRSTAGTYSVIGLLERSSPKSHHGVADVLIERALRVED